MELYYKRKLIPPPPKEAEVIIEALRKDVKPKRGWSEYGRCKEGKCPMGLHPSAMRNAPTNTDDLPIGVNFESIAAFYSWWDNFTISKAIYERASHYNLALNHVS